MSDVGGYKIERIILDHILGDGKEIHSIDDRWYFYAYSYRQTQEYLAAIAEYSALKLIRVTPMGGDDTNCIEVKFEPHPRLVYAPADDERATLLATIAERNERIAALERENARLRAAGLAMAPLAIEDDELNDTLKCRACGAFLIEDIPFEHLNDCPVVLFMEEME